MVWKTLTTKRSSSALFKTLSILLLLIYLFHHMCSQTSMHQSCPPITCCKQFSLSRFIFSFTEVCGPFFNTADTCSHRLFSCNPFTFLLLYLFLLGVLSKLFPLTSKEARWFILLCCLALSLLKPSSATLSFLWSPFEVGWKRVALTKKWFMQRMEDETSQKSSSQKECHILLNFDVTFPKLRTV